MDRMIYTAMSGASQTLARQAVVANNLANVNTIGFKAELSAFRAVPVNGSGLPTRAVTATTTPAADLSNGPAEHTGRSLDVAIDGAGWLAVQDAAGEEAYTRDGKLQLDATGLLRSRGNPVLGEGGEPIIVPLNATLSIAADGTISALGGGEAPNSMAAIGRLKLAGPVEGGVLRGPDGLFRPAGADGGTGAPLPADPNVRLQPETLEHSNVSVTQSMVEMIESARQFEMQMKTLTAADEGAREANRLLELS